MTDLMTDFWFNDSFLVKKHNDSSVVVFLKDKNNFFSR